MRFTRSLLLVPPLVLPVTLAACALLRGFTFEEPTVRLETIRVIGLDLLGGQLSLDLDVYNPNSYDLRGLGLEAQLSLEGTPFGEARLDEGFVLPADAHAPLEVPMSFTWEGVGAGARALFSRGEVGYGLSTSIRADTPVGERPVRIHLDGTVRLADLSR